jgi:beta-arrestin
MAAMEEGTKEEKQKLMDKEEVPEAKKLSKRDGTRVFKKTSPNGKITVYVGKRDFVDHVTKVDPIDGVVLVDSEYFGREGKKDRKVFAQVLAGFRYGRDDLDVLGLNFRRDLIDERMQVYPPPEPSQPQLLTLLQVRLLKKLGRNAYPFTFSLSQGLPSSVSLQPGQGEADKPCGVDFILRCFVGKQPEDKIEKRNSVRLAIKKITHAPEEQTHRPTTDVSKDFMLSSHPLVVEANLDKGTYSHGEPIKVNVSITNRSSKTVKKIKVQVRQFASICLFAQSEYKCVVAQMESE